MSRFFCFLQAVLCLSLVAPVWAQRNLKDIPDPDPKLELQSFRLAEGLEVNLYAADPLLAKPIQMNFDPQGRLWIASSSVYPQIKPGEEANDKVLVLEDTDGDGRADKTTVFADGLLIPTGLVPGDGGVYVANSTDLVHFTDKDGDGKADQQRIVLSGFGTEDTHHILHTLRWGPEGLLYMNQSIYIHSHIETPYGVRRMNGGGIWHFRPETMQLETFMLGLVNTWGHHFDRFGQSFATDGAGGEGINYVFPGWVGVTSPGAKRVMHGLNPGSPKYCGLEVVSGRHFPDDWQGNLITNDFRAHRVCRFVVSDDGSGFASKQQEDVISSSHVAFRPIDVKMGPDGALYIADWYNPIIQHGEVDFRDPRRDHVHGRIWRVTYKGRELVPRPKLSGATVPELLDQLKVPEQWTRTQAKRVLKERGTEAVLPELATWTVALAPDDPDIEAHRLEALWVYQSLNTVEPNLLQQVLASRDPRVRAAAVRVVYHWHDRLPGALALVAAAVDDEHPRVRLEAIRAASRIPHPQSCAVALRALDRPMDGNLDFALWTAARDLAPIWQAGLESGTLVFDSKPAHLEFALRAVESANVVPLLLNQLSGSELPPDRVHGLVESIAALANSEQLNSLFSLALDAQKPDWQRAEFVAALAKAAAARNVKPTGDLLKLAPLLKSEDAALKAAAARTAGQWKLEPLRDELTALASRQDQPGDVRRAAMHALTALGGEQSVLTLELLAGESPEPEMRIAAVAALAPLDLLLATDQAVQLLTAMKPGDDPSELVSTLLSHADGPARLAAALQDKSLPADVARLAIRAVRSTGSEQPLLIEAMSKAGKLGTGSRRLSPADVAALLEEVRASGNAARGEMVYRRADLNCLKCHAIGGAGGQVGPDLASIGGSAQPDYLIESLFEPSKKIKENFHSLIVLTDEGRVVTGVKVRQTDTDLILRTAEDREVLIPLDAIEEQKDGGSLMPAGLVDELTRQELVDLVSFLAALGKEPGQFSIGKARVVRRWEVLLDTPANRLALAAGGAAAVVSPTARLAWGPAYSTVSGDLPLYDLPALRVGDARQTVVRWELEVTTPGEFQVRFDEGPTAEQIEVYFDGQPLQLPVKLPPLERGRHVMTIVFTNVLKSKPTKVGIELIQRSTSPGQAQIVSGK